MEKFKCQGTGTWHEQVKRLESARGQVPGINTPSASEKIYSFRGVWRFELCYLKMLYFEDIFDII